MNPLKNRVGEKHITKEGYIVEIIEYFGRKDCTIQFENGFNVKNLHFTQIKSGQIKNPYHKSILGIGYNGVGNYSRTNHFRIYTAWNHMLQRCYNKKCQENNPTYKDCLIEEYWHNFQNFAKWFERNYREGFALDKDILIKGNKIYSTETCCFVPQEINTLFVKNDVKRGKYPIGVSELGSKFLAQIKIKSKRVHLGLFGTIEEAFQAYKTAKEAHIKEVADEWKSKLEPKVYVVMCNYQVDITD